MLNEQTMSQLSRMLLTSMVTDYKQQLEMPKMSELPFHSNAEKYMDRLLFVAI